MINVDIFSLQNYFPAFYFLFTGSYSYFNTSKYMRRVRTSIFDHHSLTILENTKFIKVTISDFSTRLQVCHSKITYFVLVFDCIALENGAYIEI